MQHHFRPLWIHSVNVTQASPITERPTKLILVLKFVSFFSALILVFKCHSWAASSTRLVIRLKVCSSCTAPLVIRLSALSSFRWGPGWPLSPLPEVTPPPPSTSPPHTGHILTTSHWFIGEDCGRAINQAPELCQRKLPLLFLQQSSSNSAFHACVERSSTIWHCFVTVTCLSGGIRKKTKNKVHTGV